MSNRRSSSVFMAALFIGAGASALAETQPAPDLGITVRRLSPRAAVFNVGPWDNAYLALSTQKGIVVIDSGFSKTVAQAVRAAIQAEFKRSDFAFLIDSEKVTYTLPTPAPPVASVSLKDITPGRKSGPGESGFLTLGRIR